MIKLENPKEYIICCYLDEKNEEQIGIFKKTEESIIKAIANNCYCIVYTDLFSKRELLFDSDKTFTKTNKGNILACKVTKTIPLKKIFPKRKKISTKEIAIAFCECLKEYQSKKETLNIEEVNEIIENNVDKIIYIGRTESPDTIEEISEKNRYTM